MRAPIELYPYLHAVETGFRERTHDQKLFRGWSETFERLTPDDLGLTINRAHLCHAAAMTLLRCGHGFVAIHDCVLRLGICDDPPMLASALKVAVEHIMYPDGDGPHDEWEWQRNAFLKRYALQAGNSLWLECRNAMLREKNNSPAFRARRPHEHFEYCVTLKNAQPGTQTDDADDWGQLMGSVEAMHVVLTGLAKLPADNVGWALMALIRYNAGLKYDFTRDLGRLRDIVALVAEVELANA